MKVLFPILFLAQLFSITVWSQDSVLNNAFEEGEVLHYRIYYTSAFSDVYSGDAAVCVRLDTINNEQVYKFVGIGESNSFFDFFYKVRDRFESYVNTRTLLPYRFILIEFF